MWVVSSGVAGLFFVFFGVDKLNLVFDYAAREPSNDTASLINLTVSLVSIAVPGALVYWMLRQLLRSFLTERGLSLDSDERLAMLDTWVGMAAAEQLGKETQLVVAQALFRPTTNAAFTDDGAPPAVLERTLNNVVDKNNN